MKFYFSEKSKKPSKRRPTEHRMLELYTRMVAAEEGEKIIELKNDPELLQQMREKYQSNVK